MANGYRSREELRQIVRAVIADSNPPQLSSFNLTASENIYFRARAAKAVEALATKASTFKAYYKLPTQNPFSPVIVISVIVIIAALAAGIEVYRNTREQPAYPVFAALLTVVAVAAGWIVVGGLAHRNTIRQNTNALLFARFAQAPFGEAMHRFHHHFQYGLASRLTREQMVELIDSGNEKNLQAAASAVYLLNYFEFIGAGVMRGDLDQTIVERNLRGVLCYYYDKCEPYILDANRAYPRIYEHLIKLRTHYREP